MHVVLILIGFIFVVSAQNLETIWLSIFQGIGGSLIATGMAGILLFLYVQRSEAFGRRIETLLVAGLAQVFPARSVVIREEYDDRLRVATKIDAMGFGLSSLREDHLRDFEDWSRRGMVRILLLDPDFPSIDNSYSSQRDIEEGNPAGTIQNDINQFVEAVQNLPSINPERFRIKKMRILPSTNVFRVDDEVFFGPYLIREQSRNSPTFLAKKGGHLFETITNHFDKIWDDDQLSVEVPLRVEVD